MEERERGRGGAKERVMRDKGEGVNGRGKKRGEEESKGEEWRSGGKDVQ